MKAMELEKENSGIRENKDSKSPKDYVYLILIH